MKILKMQSKSNEPPFVNGDVTVTADTVIVNGMSYPVLDIKAVRQGLTWAVNVAYDEAKPITQSVEPTETPAEPNKTVQTINDTPGQEQSVKTAVSNKPRFRMRKKPATPVTVTEEPIEETGPAPTDEPTEPTSDEQELQKVLEQVRAIIDQPKADYEGVVELPDGGRLELRYFKGAD